MKAITCAFVTVAFCGVLWDASAARLEAQQQPAARPTQKPAAAAPKPRPAAPAAWPKRLKDGQPDMQGVWDPLVTLPCFAGLGRGCIIDPPEKQIPYLPWAQARQKENAAGTMRPNAAQTDTRSRAWPDGVPRLTFYSEFQIMQPPGAVVILYETQHEFRYIPLDTRPQLDPAVQLWMGSSRGRWEGNTLVVEVRNLTDRMRLSLGGDFASDALTVTERWEFVDAKTLQYSATLTDPKVYSRPWTVSHKILRHPEATFELMEYAGVEGERDVTLMKEILDNVQQQKKK